MVIMWINKFSKERGYVQSVDYQNRCFINTFSYADAKKFNANNVEKVIAKLCEYGENKQNDFEVVD